MAAVKTVRALPPGALRVGYSGIPEDQERKRLEVEWGKKVVKVDYRGTEYWIPAEYEKESKKDKPNKPGTKKGGY